MLAEALERVEADFFRAESSLASMESKLTGTVRIGAPDGFGAAFLAPRIGRFTQRHSDLKLELAPVPRSFSLSKREADIAVMVGKPTTGGLIARKLTDYSLGLYASHDYLENSPPLHTVDDLQDHQLIDYVEDLIYSPELNYSREVWRGWKAHLELTSAVAQLECARGGGGVAILHDYIAAGKPDLRRVLPSVSIVRPYWIVYHESLRDIPRIRAVLDFVVEMVDEAKDSFVHEASGKR